MQMQTFVSVAEYDAIWGSQGSFVVRRHGGVRKPCDYHPRAEKYKYRAGREIVLQKETLMRKLMTILFAASLLTSLSLVAQDTMKQDNMKADASAKATSVTGKISDDGKTFVSDKDGKSWTISNPDAVKGHEGHHVTLKAKVSADTNEVSVVSLKMAGDSMKKDSSPN
jgi:pentapeptide MXKDX repeat protein